MPVTKITEGISRHFDNTSVSREYYFHGPATEAEVNAAVASLPSTVLGLPRDASSDTVDEEEEVVGDWRATIHWGIPKKREPQPLNTLEYKFSFQAPSAHIKQSLATVLYSTSSGSSSNPATVLAPNHGGAINVVWDDGKQRVEGEQLAPPPETFTLSYSVNNGIITGTYQLLVESLVGKVNSTTFRGRAAGSVMLSRVSGGKSAENAWTIEFGFSYIANTTLIPVGGFTVNAKDGHDLLWVYYGPQKDAVAKQLVVPPVAAYVERVWYRANLNNLNLPA